MSSRKPSGFTLIELLVVVAIIALLVAILLPSLSRARESARTVQCAAQLRGMSTAFAFYSAENKGFWPSPWYAYPPGAEKPSFGSTTYYNQWPYIMGFYVRETSRGTPKINSTADEVANRAYIASPDNTPTMFCPKAIDVSKDLPDQLAGETALPDGTKRYYADLLINIAIWPLTSWSYAITAVDPKVAKTAPDEQRYSVTGIYRVDKFKHPSTTMHLTDPSTDDGNTLANLKTRREGVANPLTYATHAFSIKSSQHAKQNNYLFADGHVSLLSDPVTTALEAHPSNITNARAAINADPTERDRWQSYWRSDKPF